MVLWKEEIFHERGVIIAMKKWRIASLIAVFTLILSGCGLPHLSALNPAGEVAKKQYD